MRRGSIMLGLLLLAFVVGVACSRLFPLDCGCAAFYEVPKDGDEIQIHFSTVLAETVNGGTHCGTNNVPMRVDQAMIVPRLELRETKLDDDSYVYSAPITFDPTKDAVAIEVNGKGYISEHDSVKRIDNKIYFHLRRFPPK